MVGNRRVKLLALESTLASEAPSRTELGRYGRSASMPMLTVAQLIERLPELHSVARAEPDRSFYDHSQSGSPQGPVLWREVAERVQTIFQDDPGVAGVVLIHGTNLLEEAAYFLNLTVRTEKSVVVVGAQRPWNVLSSDGPLNLLNAVRVAADMRAARRGVLVLFSDTIHGARDVTKVSTYRVEAFVSPNTGPLGYADPDVVVFYGGPQRRHTVESEFDLAEVDELPRVDILYGYGGADGGLVQAAVRLGARGLVVAGAGAGAVWGMEEALVEAMDRGVVVVRSSRLGSGRVLASDNYGGPGFVAADNLNPQKARVLLTLALTRTSDPNEVQRMFYEY